MKRFESDFDKSFRRSGYMFNFIFSLVSICIVASLIVMFVLLPYFTVKVVQTLPEDCTPAVIVTQKDGQTQYTMGCKK